MVIWTLLKLNTFSPKKTLLRKWKHQPQTGRTVSGKGFVSDYLKNYFNKIVRN